MNATVDMQAAFNVVAGIAGTLGVFVLNWMSGEIKTLHARLSGLPETYARRDDLADIKATLRRIEEKLDSKADTAA
jgi:hypothetical protein